MIGVGVDFGTSNSTVAWFDGRQLRFVETETNSPILPTAIHLSKEYEGTTGAAAIERFISNTCRTTPAICRTRRRSEPDRSASGRGSDRRGAPIVRRLSRRAHPVLALESKDKRSARPFG